MNTILITGTYKTVGTSNDSILSSSVQYDIYIWGSRFGMPLKFVAHKMLVLTGYTELWQRVKPIAVEWFDEPKMDD